MKSDEKYKIFKAKLIKYTLEKSKCTLDKKYSYARIKFFPLFV